MSYKTRLRNLCKSCKYAAKYYGYGKNVTAIWCVKRNGRVVNQPRQCDKYDGKGAT